MITINITDEIWIKLNQMKQRGETFNDVIVRLLKGVKIENGNKTKTKTND